MNQLYHGDNLEILREMPDNSVDLIATDPPFNTGKDWGAFNDKWDGGLKGYLKFMEQRCVEMHRVLKDTGSFYLHCDPTASHYLKVMLDGVFGIKQFRNEIVWHYPIATMAKRTFSRNTDTILFYSKSSKYNFYIDRVRVDYKKSSVSRAKYKDNSHYRKEGWRKLNPKGVVPDTVWQFGLAGHSSKQRLGYPTQKPIALYQRIIKASSNQGDIVLDPFAGSGTTLDAAQSLGRQWIGIDAGQAAIDTIQKRMQDRHGLLLEYEVIV